MNYPRIFDTAYVFRDKTSTYKGLGRFTFFTGIYLVIVSIIGFIGSSYSEFYTDYNKFFYWFFYIMMLVVGISLIVLGEYKRRNLFYNNEIHNSIDKYSTSVIFRYKIFAVLSSVLVFGFETYEFIFIFNILKRRLYYSHLSIIDYLIFYSTFRHLIPVFGFALLIVWYLRDFGKKKGTLFSTGLLVFAHFEFYSIFLSCLAYLYSKIGIYSQTIEMNAWSISILVGFSLLGILFILLSYNKKKAFPRTIMRIMLVFLIVICLFFLFLLGRSIYYSIIYSTYNLDVDALCNVILASHVFINCFKFDDLYYITISKQKREAYTEINIPEKENAASDGILKPNNVGDVVLLKSEYEKNPILFCRKCGNRLVKGNLQCTYCGTKIQKEE